MIQNWKCPNCDRTGVIVTYPTDDAGRTAVRLRQSHAAQLAKRRGWDYCDTTPEIVSSPLAMRRAGDANG